MIKTIVFDLDDTLVQSERLKTESYAIAVQRLRGLAGPEKRAAEAYREIVGASREVASRHIVERLDLEEELRHLMPEHDASEPTEIPRHQLSAPERLTVEVRVPADRIALADTDLIVDALISYSLRGVPTGS